MQRFLDAAVVMLVMLVTLFGAPALAQESASGEEGAPAADKASEASAFTEEQLGQIAGPVALYPDSLLAQIFMASTYPLEVVEADRWMKKEKPAQDKINEALKDKDWDPSVKSLCSLPDVLSRMSENLDWTRDMGDAFLAQREDLFAAVQSLRGKAKETGNLETTQEQVVTVEGANIVIESSDPEVIYVPSYSPTVVYGTTYPAPYYPPLYAPPAYGYGLLSFGVGMAVGGAIWGDCDWGGSDVNIDVDRNNNFNRNTSRNSERNTSNKFQHNSSHRKGVNYRDGATANKFGGSGQGNRVSKNDARGYDRAGSSGASDRARAGTADRSRGSGTRDAGASRNQGGNKASNRSGSSAKKSGGGMSGSRNPSLDKSASNRGKSSRSSSASRGGSGSRSSASRGGGGGSRGGGGGGGGGRGGGGRR